MFVALRLLREPRGFLEFAKEASAADGTRFKVTSSLDEVVKAPNPLIGEMQTGAN